MIKKFHVVDKKFLATVFLFLTQGWSISKTLILTHYLPSKTIKKSPGTKF